jgi:glycine oxidase
VHLFDRDTQEGKNSCGLAGAGMLAPYCELEKTGPKHLEMALASLELWPSTLEHLPAQVYFQREGSLFLAHPQDAADMERVAGLVFSRLGGRSGPRWLGREEWYSMEPELSQRFSAALFFPDEGQVEGWDLFPAIEKALAGKVAWHPCVEVEELGPGFIIAQGIRHSFDLCVDCRGLGARGDLADLRGVRGELYALHAPEVHLSRPVRLAHPRFPLYIAPRPGNIYLVGATSIESESLEPVTVQSSLELLSAAYSVHSGFAEAHIVNTSVNCRPAFPDNEPRLIGQPGLLRLNGLFRHGFLLAPLMAEESLAWLEKRPLAFPHLLHPPASTPSAAKEPIIPH